MYMYYEKKSQSLSLSLFSVVCDFTSVSCLLKKLCEGRCVIILHCACRYVYAQLVGLHCVYTAELRSFYQYVGEGRVRWGGWVRLGGGLVEKTTKAAMLIFWHRYPIMLPDKPQYKPTPNSLLFSP